MMYQNLSKRSFSIFKKLCKQTECALKQSRTLSVSNYEDRDVSLNLKEDAEIDHRRSGLFDLRKLYSDEGFTTKEIINHIIDLTVRVTEWELLALKEQEQLLNHSLSEDDLAWRGLVLDNLIHDDKFFNHINSTGEVDVKFKFSENEPDDRAFGTHSFRTGSLVNVCVNSDNDFSLDITSKRREKSADWRTIPGIVSYAGDSFVVVRMSTLSEGFILDSFSKRKRPKTVSIFKKSEINITERALKSLNDLRSSKINKTMLKLIIGEEINFSRSHSMRQKVHIFKNDMDDSKLEAIRLASDLHPLTIIHGPPGTGKTTVLAAAILSAVANGERVLATAPSHAAVDALASAIISQWPQGKWGDPKGKVIRIGNDLRVTMPAVLPYLPLNQSQLSKDQQQFSKQLHQIRMDLLESNENDGKGELMREEIKLRKLLTENNMSNENRIIESAQIVLCTCLVANNRKSITKAIEKNLYQTVCIDEAAFVTNFSSFPTILRANRIILSGDHFQLPPVVLSERARADGLGVSLMERLAIAYPERVALLSVQYRANKIIPGWSSERFYKSCLTSHKTVADITLSDLRGVTPCPETRVNILFIDTKGCGFRENSHGIGAKGDESFANFDEAFLVEQVVRKYVGLGVKPSAIGVISPYWAQVSILRSLLWDGPIDLKPVSIHTVDGFQGREKELIVISFVRSNKEKIVGFLSETRRINVSVTRAKRCCIAIGDSSTLESDDGLESFINYCKSHKAIVKATDML